MKSKLRQSLNMSSARCYSFIPLEDSMKFTSKSPGSYDSNFYQEMFHSASSSPEYVPDIEDSPFSSPNQSPAYSLVLEADKLDFYFGTCPSTDSEDTAADSRFDSGLQGASCADCGSLQGSHMDFCMNPSFKLVVDPESPTSSPMILNTSVDPLICEVFSKTPSQHPLRRSTGCDSESPTMEHIDSVVLASEKVSKPHLDDHCYNNPDVDQATDASDVDSGDEIDVVGLPEDDSDQQDSIVLQERSILRRPGLKRPALSLIIDTESRPKAGRFDEDEREQLTPSSGEQASPQQSPPNRSQHNQLERQRRNDIKSLFFRLRDSVPESCRTPRASKLVVLRNACRFLNTLRSLSSVLERQERELKTRQIRLIQDIAKYPEGRKMLNVQQRKPSSSPLQ